MALREEEWMGRTCVRNKGKQVGDGSDWRAGMGSLEEMQAFTKHVQRLCLSLSPIIKPHSSAL